jgi:hypothetical protein
MQVTWNNMKEQAPEDKRKDGEGKKIEERTVYGVEKDEHIS